MSFFARFLKFGSHLGASLVKVVLITMTMAHMAYAAQTTNETIAVVVPASKKVAMALGLVLDLSYNANMYAEGDINQTSYTNLTIVPSYKITDKLTTSARADISKHHTQEENTEMSNTRIRFSYLTAQLTDQISWSNRLDGYIPTNRKDQLTNRLITATGIGTSLKYAGDVTTATLGVGLIRSYHEFDYSTTGEPLNEYSAMQALVLDFNMTEKLSLSIDGTYIIARTYQNAERYSFLTGTSLGYQMTKNFSASVGLSNGGNALKANGVNSNIEFLNEKTSKLSAGIGYTY